MYVMVKAHRAQTLVKAWPGLARLFLQQQRHITTTVHFETLTCSSVALCAGPNPGLVFSAGFGAGALSLTLHGGAVLVPTLFRRLDDGLRT